MSPLWVVSLLVSATLAAPLDQDDSTKITYAYAVDIAAPTSTTTFRCYGIQNYKTVFVQIYQPANGGTVNSNGATNIQNVISAGLGAEAFITPQPVSSKQGSQQLDEAYNYITNQGINLRSVWIQVTSPINWPSNQQNNINFINSILLRASQRNLGVAIYTNSYDWMQITNGWNGAISIPGGADLWYWHVVGSGASGQTQPNFNDFSSFSGWSRPLIKQFGQNINMCSTNVNVNVYKVSNKDVAQVEKAADDKPVAGLLLSSLKQ